MSAFNTRLSCLFNSYYNQTATAQEQLFEIIRASANDIELTSLIQQAWNNLKSNQQLFDATKSMDMLNRILQHKTDHYIPCQTRPPDNNRSLIKLGVSATLLVFVSFGAYVLMKRKRQRENINQKELIITL